MFTIVEFKEGISLALDSLKANKFRSFMTILGVFIGVASVIAMASIIAGLDNQVTKEIEGLGSNSIFVTKFPPDTDYGKLTEEERNRKPIDYEATQAILKNCPSVNGVAPQNYYRARGGNIVKYKNNQANSPSFFGTLPAYPQVTTRNIARGRFFNQLDMQRRAMVCVIGDDVAKALFPTGDPLLKQIRVNNRPFTVIGVMERLDESMFNDGSGNNNYITIPYSTYEKLIPWEKELFLQVSAVSMEDMPQAIDEITTVMRRLRGVPYDKPNDFSVWTQERLKDIAGDIAGVIYMISLSISGLGLMVGGIGVANIMLVSVTERTREIGVRKALGARKVNILWQFLTEAMTLSGTGGVIGIIFGILIAFIVKLIGNWPFTVSIVWIVIGFSVSVAVGLIAGVYPAYKAARTDPIISLRYE